MRTRLAIHDLSAPQAARAVDVGTAEGIRAPVSRKLPWWIVPHRLMAFLIVPLFCILFMIPEVLSDDATHVRFKLYFDGTAFALGGIFLLTLCAFAWLFFLANDRYGANRRSEPDPAYPFAIAEAAALLTLAAYFLAFRGFIVNPGAALSLFVGADGSFLGHTVAPKIAGVTSLTQLGVVFATLVMTWRFVYGQVVPRRHWVYLIVILAFTVFRSFAWTERLSLIEFAAPIAVIAFGHVIRPSSGLRKVVVVGLPFFGVVAVFVLFGITEYFRSWITFYGKEGGNSFVEFVVRRVLGYYYTSLNNGAGLLRLTQWPDYTFIHTAHWLHQFPLGIGTVLSDSLGRPASDGFLLRYADPEFSNPSGVFTAILDLGVGGALWYAAIWGGLLGYWSVDFARGRGLGVLMFPVTFISLPEIFRFLYLGNSRAFLIVVAMLMIHLVIRGRAVRGRRRV